MAPGSVYATSVTGDGTVGLYRLEVSLSSGSGKLKPAGGISGSMKESIQRAFAFLQANKGAFSISQEADRFDFRFLQLRSTCFMERTKCVDNM